MDVKIIQLDNYKNIPPNNMDSFDGGTIEKSSNGNSNNHNGNGGSSNMDKYATKEELKHTQELLSEKIDHRSDVIEEKIVSVKNQVESSNKLLYWILGIFGAVFTGLLIAILTK
ncbi:hypothetical protein D1B17_07220 [Companilactobacillus zhachilii]|uniref:Uncharacterized protein n=1 Tax=Companilactobacillus zhachilii TaxID=2304606 RepID=A0A386PU83_9LACO|nr:hypothetical protein [Companilactobacillus zhachilii]AYE38439.1 hypothetical protein D1B17_07220 [Companilactobacillus zhachilii]